ncbi:MAG: hypothetical protein JXB05_22545 [Myxococcaceae bacterium]|nr:hypothetical protein [Myxococcaceae bacterium]
MHRLLEPWLLLAALLAASPALAQAAAEAPSPPPASQNEEPPLAAEEDAGTEELAEEVPPEEVEVPPSYAEEDEGESAEPQPSGYSDATGNLENLEAADGLRVTVRMGTLHAKRGYTPLEVMLHNAEPVPRLLRLSFQGYSSGSSRTTREVELAPHQRLTTYLLVPAPVQSGSFTVEGPNLRTRSTGVYMDEGNGLPTLVLGTSKALEASTGLTRSEGRKLPQLNARFLPAQEAPRELAAYVGYPAVLVTEDAASVPADVWAALEGYAATGGSLILARPPRDVGQRLPLLARAPERGAWNAYGFGEVYLCKASGGCASAVDSADKDAKPPLDPVGPPPRWANERFALRGGQKPLLPNALAPVGRFLVLIFLFSLVVGPGGMVLARRKGPAALLIGVPAVALLTCLIIVADSLMGDGFVTHATRYSYTWLDRPRDRLITSAVAGYYANLASDTVQVPASGVLLAPEEREEWYVDVDWKGGGMVADGFLPSRTYVEWGELAVTPTRARLVVRREGAAWKVQNALGAPLQAGFVQLGKKRYELPALGDGEEGVATELKEQGEEEAPLTDFVTRPQGLSHRSKASAAFSLPLQEGDFLARVGGRGFGPLATLEVQLHEGIHYVRGQVDGP